MRHTVSSLAHESMKDLLALAQLLGHADPGATLKHYIQSSLDAVERTTEAVRWTLFRS